MAQDAGTASGGNTTPGFGVGAGVKIFDDGGVNNVPGGTYLEEEEEEEVGATVGVSFSSLSGSTALVKERNNRLELLPSRDRLDKLQKAFKPLDLA